MDALAVLGSIMRGALARPTICVLPRGAAPLIRVSSDATVEAPVCRILRRTVTDTRTMSKASVQGRDGSTAPSPGGVLQSAPSATLRRAAQADPAIRARTASQRTEPPGGHGRAWPSPPRTGRDEAAARSADAPSASRCRDHSLIQSVIHLKRSLHLATDIVPSGASPLHLPGNKTTRRKPESARLPDPPFSVRRRWLRLQRLHRQRAHQRTRAVAR